MIIPRKGQYVRIMFRVGIVEEGYVVDWSDSATIEDKRGDLLVIPDLADIVAIKIHAQKQVNPQPVYRDIEERPVEPTDTKTLGQLHLLRKQQELESARKLMTTFEASGLQPTQYHYAGIKQPSYIDPREEIQPGSARYNR